MNVLKNVDEQIAVIEDGCKLLAVVVVDGYNGRCGQVLVVVDEVFKALAEYCAVGSELLCHACLLVFGINLVNRDLCGVALVARVVENVLLLVPTNESVHIVFALGELFNQVATDSV